MDVETDLPSNQQHSTSDPPVINKDPIVIYVVNSNLSISEMIEQYKVSMINSERKKQKQLLRCAVCGEKAVGYNFDQITCESCKAFFRRNAVRDINELHCRFSGNCEITTATRRYCPYCRIKKCFSVGMRKEWIRSERKQSSKHYQVRDRNHLQQPIISNLMTSKRSNNRVILSATDRTRLNNLTHCYDKFSAEPSVALCSSTSKTLSLRLHEFLNIRRADFVNFVSYFKHLPEFQTLNIDDQVALIKRNVRLLTPLNYAILRAPTDSKFRTTHIQIIGCRDNVDPHEMLRLSTDTLIDIIRYDPLLMKLFIVVLFFTTTSSITRSICDPGEYQQLNHIKQTQTSYIKLLWLYILEKYGEENAIHLFTRLITKYLHVQVVVDQVDTIIQLNNDTQNIDALMQTMLQLT